MHKVTINGKTEYAKSGTLLSDLLISSESPTEHPCGGKGLCRKCEVLVNGRKELSCQYRITSDIEVITESEGEIYSETGAEESEVPSDSICFALDIGTTTLALAVVATDKKKILKVLTRNNPQRVFGADIMSRIEYCQKNGTEKLQKMLISEINSMMKASGVQGERLFVSGNTTMLHLFFGVDCTSIGIAPYTPVFLESKTVNAEDMGISDAKTVISLPSVSAFTGADIVAGLNYIKCPESEKYSLLVDLGTNAEIVLFSRQSALCTAAAAGPCFEGASISCGMSASDGAVYSYSADGIKTVGDAPVKGICGTGLIDIIAYLLKNGILDETGFMENDFEIANGVVLTKADIRQYQLAKSAVYSAILTLIRLKDITFDDIEGLYISGGFSAKINVENAVLTGLIPRELKDKCIAVNNSSLLGTVKYSYENNDLDAICNSSAYVDLSAEAVFSDLFIENMMFSD